MRLDAARAIADAVLVEGYALYPYRASAPKNQFRWAFGVLAPRAWSEAGGCETWWLESQLLVTGPARVSGLLRLFQIQRRRVEAATATGFAPVESLDAAGDLVVGWDEGVVRTVDLDLDTVTVTGTVLPFAFDGGRDIEPAAGGRVIRERHPLAGRIIVHCEPVIADLPVRRLILRVENTTPWPDQAAPRDHAIIAAFASTHLILAITGGEFISLLDPPAWASGAAAACRNTGTYPVLACPAGARDVVLSAPIILYDHPQIAPESPHDLFDATENDELLTLRTLTLTDDEKRQARATDRRTAAVIDGVDALSDEWLARLHGATRNIRGGEMVPRPPQFTPGCRVRLNPPSRRTDAQDVLYAGMLATVAEVRHDVDGSVFLAVTIDDDPAAELHDWYGRYHHYRTDEVELVDPAPGEPAR